MSANGTITQLISVKLKSWLLTALRSKGNVKVLVSISPETRFWGKIKKTETAQMQRTFKVTVNLIHCDFLQ